MWPATLPAHKPIQNGYILIEGLIVAVLISVGVLAMAGLQKTGLTLSNASLLRSKATILSYEMADRVRANLPAYTAGAYNNLTGTPSSPGCIASGCTALQLAQNDYYEWRTELAAKLPSGRGVVCLTNTSSTGTPGEPSCSGTGETLAIKIWWTQKNEKNGDVAGQAFFFTTFRP